jgi:hypothetical protein
LHLLGIRWPSAYRCNEDDKDDRVDGDEEEEEEEEEEEILDYDV